MANNQKNLTNNEDPYKRALNDHEWIAANGIELHNKYRGEWIAIANCKLLAHGHNFNEVATAARQLCPDPIFMQIPIEDTIIYEQS